MNRLAKNTTGLKLQAAGAAGQKATRMPVAAAEAGCPTVNLNGTVCQSLEDSDSDAQPTRRVGPAGESGWPGTPSNFKLNLEITI